MRTASIALSVLAACSAPVPPRNLAIDFVTFAAPEAVCQPLAADTAICRLPDKSLVYCSAAAGKPTCEAMGPEKAKGP